MIAHGGVNSIINSRRDENWSESKNILTGESREVSIQCTFISNTALQADSQAGTAVAKNQCTDFKF